MQPRLPRPICLGDLARRGAKLSVWCQMCGRHRLMHVATLIARLGRGASLESAASHLTCSACGSRRIDARPHYRGLGVVVGHNQTPQKSKRN